MSWTTGTGVTTTWAQGDTDVDGWFRTGWFSIGWFLDNWTEGTAASTTWTEV